MKNTLSVKKQKPETLCVLCVHAWCACVRVHMCTCISIKYNVLVSRTSLTTTGYETRDLLKVCLLQAETRFCSQVHIYILALMCVCTCQHGHKKQMVLTLAVSFHSLHSQFDLAPAHDGA